MVDRTAYFNLQTSRLVERLESIRLVMKLLNNTSIHPMVETLLTAYIPTFNNINTLREISIKSQEDLDFYIKTLSEFENTMKSLYKLIYMVNPHIEKIVAQYNIGTLLKGDIQ
jgi:esterase/lipase